MAPYHILIVIISSVIPENLVLLTKSEQSGPKSAHIRPTSDDRMKDKELEKLEKFQLLKDEIAKVWHMQKVIVVPVVIGAFGAVSVNFKEYR